MTTFIQYSKCGTCRKAAKWLQENNIDVTPRDIISENPNREELTKWITISKLPINKFFNTSGLVYKELKIKDIIKTATSDELINLLASDGKLIKRPILIKDQNILLGFNEEQWSQTLL